MIFNEEMKSAFRLMKSAVSPPNEAKPPSHSHFSHFISSLAKRLHSFISPVMGGFIEKCVICYTNHAFFMEQGTGVEPALTAWEAAVIPIYQPCAPLVNRIIAQLNQNFNTQFSINYCHLPSKTSPSSLYFGLNAPIIPSSSSRMRTITRPPLSLSVMLVLPSIHTALPSSL